MKPVLPSHVFGHRDNRCCPRCKKLAFCDDCSACSGCGFRTPKVTPATTSALSRPPAPARGCRECGGKVVHTRRCSMTVRVLTN